MAAHALLLIHGFRSVRRLVVVFGIVGAIASGLVVADGRAEAAAVAAERWDPITSPDVGDHCADGLSAEQLDAFFARPIGGFEGADYQRALRLPDDRVLWTFQDAFVSGVLVHNVGIVQSGRCFTVLNDGARSWLLGERTTHMRRWHWILGGGIGSDGTTIHLFVAEMAERGRHYLAAARPVALRRIALDARSLAVVETVEVEVTGDDLYGWSVTAHGDHTYLYSHCYQQFGHDTLLGFGDCAVDVKLARIPVGQYDAPYEYWVGDGWGNDPTLAVPVVDGHFVMSGNNPSQIRADGDGFVLVQKSDDWWGTTVAVGVSDVPQGPFRPVATLEEPLKCARELCNTYFASWVPWKDEGRYIWSIGHNRWDGSETRHHLEVYRPSIHTVDVEPKGERTIRALRRGQGSNAPGPRTDDRREPLPTRCGGALRAV